MENKKMNDLLQNTIKYINKKKYLKTVLIIALVVLAIFVGVILVKQSQELRRRAAGENIVLSMSPSAKTVQPNEEFDLDLLIDTNGSHATAVDFTITYDSSVIHAVSAEVGTDNFFTVSGVQSSPHVLQEAIVENPTDGSGNLKMVIGTGPTSEGKSGSGRVAVVHFETVGSSGSTAVSISPQTMATVLEVEEQSVNTTFYAANVTVQSAPSDEARLYFSEPRPVNPQSVGSDFEIDILMDTGGQSVDGVDARIEFSPDHLSVVELNNSPSVFSSYPLSDYDNSAGIISVSANIGSGTTATPINDSGVKISTITFSPEVVVSSTQLTYDFTPGERNDSNIVLAGTLQDQDPVDILESVSNSTIVINPQATSTPIPTNTPIPTGLPTDTPTPTSIPPQEITVKFSFQGRLRSGVSSAKEVSFSYRFLQELVEPVILNTDSSGEAQISLAPNDYVMLADAPGYLARRFGSHSSPVSVSSGQTYLDLSPTPLLGGNFNEDSVINEVDYGIFLSKFMSDDELCDLDGSGEVNNLDFGIMRSNWNLVDDTI